MTETTAADALLRQLVERMGEAGERAWEPFVAVRIGVRDVVVFHPDSQPIHGMTMALIDELGCTGLLDVDRRPSGARLLQVTPAGFARVRSAAAGARAAAD